MVNVSLYVPGDMTLPPKLSDAATGEDCTLRFAETGCGPHHVLTFPELPRGIDLALRVIGESVRIPGAWATVGGQRMSSLVALWNRLDCYRQSLPHIDRIAYCQGRAAALRSLLGCGVPACATPCQFVCPQCMVKENAQLASLVHPETHMLLVFGEIDWCPNLVRPAQP